MKNLKKETLGLSIITGISVACNLGLHILLGRFFGIGKQLDCLFISLTLLNFFTLFTNLFTALFIPVYHDIYTQDKTDALVFVDVVIKWMLLMSVFLILLIKLWEMPILKMIASGFDQESLLLTKDINQMIIFSLIFFSLSNICTAVLNAKHIYMLAGLTMLFDPLFNCLFLLVLGKHMGVKSIALGYLTANFLRAVILTVYLYKKNAWRPTWAIKHKKLTQLISQSAKISYSSFLWGFRQIITKTIASRLGEGAVALFFYAEKIILVLTQIIVNPLVRVYFTRACEFVSAKKWWDLDHLFNHTVKINMFVSIFLTCGFLIFLPDLLSLLFAGSKFSPEDIKILSLIFNIMLFYFLIESFEPYILRLLYAFKKTGAAAAVITVNVVSLYAFSVIFTNKYAIYGLSSAVVAAQLITVSLLYWAVKKVFNISLLKLIPDISAYLIQGIIFIALGLAVKNYISSSLIIVFVVWPVWLLSYFIYARYFFKKETDLLLSWK